LDNFKEITIVIDEMIDNGLVFNTDSENIEQRLTMKEVSTGGSSASASASNEGGYFTNVKNFHFLNFLFILY